MNSIIAHDLKSSKATLEENGQYHPAVSLWVDESPVAYCLYSGDEEVPFGEPVDLAALITGFQPEQIILSYDTYFTKHDDEGEVLAPSLDPSARSALMIMGYDSEGAFECVMQPYGIEDDGSVSWGEPEPINPDTMEAQSRRFQYIGASIEVAFKVQKTYEDDIELRRQLCHKLNDNGWIYIADERVASKLGLEGGESIDDTLD